MRCNAEFGTKKRTTAITDKCTSTLLREMWNGMPTSVMVKMEEPKMLTEEDMWANYGFKGSGMQDPVALIYRVCTGVKPVATILMRCPKKIHATQKSVLVATQKVGLGCQTYFGRTGRREAVVCQPSATLAHYYDPDAVVARYGEAGITLPKDIFSTPLRCYGRGLVNEQFPEDIRLPLIGLCFGYPINETIDMVRAVKAKSLEKPGELAEGSEDILLRHAEHAEKRVGRNGLGVRAPKPH